MRQVESRRGYQFKNPKNPSRNNKRDPLLFIKEKDKFLVQNDRILRKKSDGCEKEESSK